MTPTLRPGALAQARPRDWAVRFVFGGLVAAAAGWIAHRFGPEIGGLFLAFPSILPASLTFAEERDGRRAALDEARGAVLGGLGLAAFALVTWSTASVWPAAAVLAAATLAWSVVSVAAWTVRYGIR